MAFQNRTSAIANIKRLLEPRGLSPCPLETIEHLKHFNELLQNNAQFYYDTKKLLANIEESDAIQKATVRLTTLISDELATLYPLQASTIGKECLLTICPEVMNLLRELFNDDKAEETFKKFVLQKWHDEAKERMRQTRAVPAEIPDDGLDNLLCEVANIVEKKTVRN